MTSNNNDPNTNTTSTATAPTNAGQLASSQALSEILATFPQEHLVYAFGYGSGVFSQNINVDKHQQGGMVDLILVVNNTFSFHKANLAIHPRHYASWLQYAGPSSMTWMQQSFPLVDGRVLFQVVDDDDDPIPMKYGVIHIDDLCRDLTEWTALYIAGRLHKPTMPIPLLLETTTMANSTNTSKEAQVQALLQAQEQNLQSALAAALLLLLGNPDTTRDEDSTTTNATSTVIPWTRLYSQIASLSYTGDFRMQVGGEDPQKIDKLVQASGQLDRFHTLYRPFLQPLQTSGMISFSNNNNGGLEWNPHCDSMRQSLRLQLPPRLQHRFEDGDDDLSQLLASIVAPAARHQSLKGLFTLGIRKSLRYASAKLQKGILRKR